MQTFCALVRAAVTRQLCNGSTSSTYETGLASETVIHRVLVLFFIPFSCKCHFSEKEKVLHHTSFTKELDYMSCETD